MKRVPVPDKHKNVIAGGGDHPAYKGWREMYSYPSARIMLKALFFYVCRQGAKR